MPVAQVITWLPVAGVLASRTVGGGKVASLRQSRIGGNFIHLLLARDILRSNTSAARPAARTGADCAMLCSQTP